MGLRTDKPMISVSVILSQNLVFSVFKKNALKKCTNTIRNIMIICMYERTSGLICYISFLLSQEVHTKTRDRDRENIMFD